MYLENVFHVYFRLCNTSAKNCIASENYNLDSRSKYFS